jgi:hypothetical protein
MDTWHELERRFQYLESTLRGARLDRQTGAAGEYWRVAAASDRLATSRFEVLSRAAGRKLRSDAEFLRIAVPAEVMEDDPEDKIVWYRALALCTGFYENGLVGLQENDDGSRAGAIYTGNINNPAGVAATYCLELASMSKESRAQQGAVTINVSGVNARLNVGSTDNSINTHTYSSVFADLRACVESKIPAGDQNLLLERIAEMERDLGRPSFSSRYSAFIQAAANHISIIAPFLPALSALLTS